jgi:hypothetical protein
MLLDRMKVDLGPSPSMANTIMHHDPASTRNSICFYAQNQATNHFNRLSLEIERNFMKN